MPPLHPFASFQVLIADDERTIQRIVYDVLMQLGFTNVTPVNSGRAAIELLGKQSFDLIITDWRMGDMDGIDIVRFVRQMPNMRTTPIIMLTGNTEAHYVLTARDAGVNGYLIKPFSAEQLVKRIRTVIENPSEFVISPGYKGPDRRRPGGITDQAPKVERRKRRKR